MLRQHLGTRSKFGISFGVKGSNWQTCFWILIVRETWARHTRRGEHTKRIPTTEFRFPEAQTGGPQKVNHNRNLIFCCTDHFDNNSFGECIHGPLGYWTCCNHRWSNIGDSVLIWPPAFIWGSTIHKCTPCQETWTDLLDERVRPLGAQQQDGPAQGVSVSVELLRPHGGEKVGEHFTDVSVHSL